MIKLTKERAEKLMRGLRVTTLFPTDWQIADDDIAKMEDLLNQAGATDDTDEAKVSAFISKVFRYDSKTHLIMSEGFAVGNNVAYFIDEADAVAWLNEHGVPCATFDEGVAFMNERHIHGYRHTGRKQWFDSEQDYFLVSSTGIIKAIHDAQMATGFWESAVIHRDKQMVSFINKATLTECHVTALNDSDGLTTVWVSKEFYDYKQTVKFEADKVNATIYQIRKHIYIDCMAGDAKENIDLENLVLAPLSLTRAELQDYANDIKIRSPEQAPDDWAITDEDSDDIIAVLTELGVNAHTSSEDIGRIIGECFRMDSKTHRVMTAGFVIGDDEAWFIEEQDAIDYLNANGVACDNIEQAKANTQLDFYEGGWFDEGYRANFSFNEH